MRALASSDSRAARAIRVASIAVVRSAQRLDGGARSAAARSGLDADVARLDVELGQRLAHPIARGSRVLERMAERRRRIDRREHLAARRLDVGLEAFDFAMRRVVGARTRRPASPPRARARSPRRWRRVRRSASSTREPARGALRAALELGRYVVVRACERLHLLAVERDLLLAGG